MTQPPAVPPGHPARSRRRMIVVALVTALVCTLSIGAGALWYVRAHLKQLGVEEWSVGLGSIGLNHLMLDRVSLRRSVPRNQPGLEIGEGADSGSMENRTLQVDADHARVSWSWSNGVLPGIDAVHIGNLRVVVDGVEGEDDESVFLAGTRIAPEAWSVPDWLPERVELAHWSAELPCASGRCQLSGQGSLRRSPGEKLELNLTMMRGEHSVNLGLNYHPVEGVPQLNASLRLAESELLALDTGLLSVTENGFNWRGSVDLQGIPKQPWLLDWLAEWQPKAVSAPRDQALDQVELHADWNLELPRQFDDSGWRGIGSGEVVLQARLPEAVTLPVLGTLSGFVDLDLKLAEGKIERYRLDGDLRAPRLPGLDQVKIPAGLDPGPVRVQVKSEGQWQSKGSSEAPLKLTVTSDGDLKGSLVADVVLRTEPSLSAELIDSTIRLASDHVVLTETMTLDGATAELSAKGIVNGDAFDLVLMPDSKITAQRLIHPNVELDQAVVKASRLTLGRQATGLKIAGDLRVDATNVIQEQLKPQPWVWQGTLQYLAGQLNLKGSARADSGLTLANELSLGGEPHKRLRLDWQASDVFLLAGNPLPKTFVRWPELVELSRGRLSAKGWFERTGDSSETAQEIILNLKDVSGLYDRSLVDGLSGAILFSKDHGYLTLASEGLVAQQIDHGVAMGPLRLAGSYTTADIADFAHGMVDIKKFEAQVLGGRVWIEPTHFNLSEQEIALPMVIRGIDLAKVLKLYRSAELTGYGTVDGMLPLRISKQGVSMAEGNVQARPPGGALQYRPERAQALAQSDESMKLIVNVLDDFQYSVLSSDVSYAESGKLTLAVQLQGRNPNMRDSPPVNLNINLEKNLPMFLASLQLANNVSDKIKKRVSEALERRARKNSAKDNPETERKDEK